MNTKKKMTKQQFREMIKKEIAKQSHLDESDIKEIKLIRNKDGSVVTTALTLCRYDPLYTTPPALSRRSRLSRSLARSGSLALSLSCALSH